MNKNGFNPSYNAAYIDNLLNFLQKPDIVEAKSISNSLWSIGSKALTVLSRAKNTALSDGIWYDEAKARQLVIDYINNPACTKALQPYHAKIVEIYERLAHLSRGSGTWADQIDKELLLTNQSEKTDAAKPEDEAFQELNTMILNKVFVPDNLEEQIFDVLEESQNQGKEIFPKTSTNDPAGAAPIFIRIKNLAPPTNKYLFHIHADEFGAASQLEGAQSQKAVDYLHSYLSATKSPSCSAALLDELKGALSMTYEVPDQGGSTYMKTEMTQDYVKKGEDKIARAFQSKQPLLIMGGWTGKPTGHAIYYEVLPSADQKSATFRLYNTGAGVTSHPNARDGSKVKYQSYCEWKGIDRKKLESPLFLEALYELKSYDTTSNIGVKTAYDAPDIYSALKNLLQPNEEGDGPELALDARLLMTPQRSGVCSWRSLMAFMRTKMALADYKRFKCDIKLQSLGDYVEAHPTGVTAADWRLVKKSHQKLCRSLLRLQQNGIVGDAYLQSAKTALEPVSQWIHRHASCRSMRGSDKTSFSYKKATGDSALENKNSLPQPLEALSLSKQTDATARQPCLYMLEAFESVALKNSDAIESDLKAVNALAKKAWIAHEDAALHKGLINCVAKLELNEDFWRTAVAGSPDKAEALIAQLGELSSLFIKSCFTTAEPQVIFPEKVYVFYKLLYLQEILCSLGHPQSDWKNVVLAPRKLPYSIFFNLSDPKMQREMSAIVAKKSFKESVGIGDRGLLIGGREMGLGMGFNKNFQARTFEELIRKECPQIIKEISQRDKNFSGLSKWSQDAEIYASDLLPDWVKAMRNTYLAVKHLEMCSVGALAGLDRNADVRQQFFISHEKDESTVYIRLVGVTNDLLKQPEVKELQTNASYRYFGQYRKITGKPIKQLLFFLRDGKSNLSEKALSNIDAKDKRSVGTIEMANEEFRELVRLFLNPELQVVETLEYFTKHPDKLKDSDYQTLLHILLFKTGALDNDLKIAGFAGVLSRFVEKNYEQFKENDDIPAMVFFLKLAHQLKGFCPEEAFFCHTTERLQALASSEGIEAEVRSLVYAELLAQLSHKEQLSDEEVVTMLSGGIYIEENQANSKYTEDPSASKEGREGLMLHARWIERALQQQGNPNKLLLNRILHSLRPAITDDKEWVIKTKAGQFPSFSTADGQHTLYPLRSRLISSQAPALLPLAIRKNPLFRDLFPTIEQGSYRPGDIFAFNDQRGRETLVHMNGDHIVIEQKLEDSADGWFRYIPAPAFLEEKGKDKLNSLIGSRYLIDHYSHWQALKEGKDDSAEIYAMDRTSGERTYRIISQTLPPADVQRDLDEKVAGQKEALKKAHIALYGTFIEFVFESKVKELNNSGEIKESKIDPNATCFLLREVTRLSDGAVLGRPSELLTDAEDPAYIHDWYDKEGHRANLKQVELPRFALSFTPDPTAPNTLLCTQFPGYKINSTTPVKELGVHRNFILIENAKGQRKVLIPRQNFKAPEKKEVLLPRYEIDRSLERGNSEPQRYFVFDLEKNGKLFSKARDANLYLAQVVGTAQEYKRAASYLRMAGAKLTAYTDEEARILHNISKTAEVTGDSSGNGIALQLYADYLLVKNALAHHCDVSKEDMGALRSHYALYAGHLSSVTVCKLLPAEELLIVKTLLSEKFDAALFKRLQNMAPSAARELRIPADASKGVAEKIFVRSLEGFKIPNVAYEERYGKLQKNYYEVLLTRPQQMMDTYFRFFYQLARKGGVEEKARLTASLYFLRSADAGRHAGMASFFEAVLENPSAFPDIPYKKDFIDRKNEVEIEAKWENLVREAATRQLAMSPIVKKNILRQEGAEIRSSDMPDDGDAAAGRAIKIDFKLPTLQTISGSCKESRCFKMAQEDLSSAKKIQGAALAQLLQTCSSEDPIQQKEVGRLQTDLIAYQKRAPAPLYTADKGDIEKISQILSKDKAEDTRQIDELEKQILTLANKNPDSHSAQVKRQLEKWGGLRKVITLEEVIVNFSSQDHSALLRRNPSLDDEDINNLMTMVGTFLLYATRDQQRGRAQAALDKVESAKGCDAKEYSDLVNQLADRCLAERYYLPKERPAYLVFEYFANIAMRQPQVEKLEKFLGGGDLNLVMEMIMGSGKSKVLLPLLGLMRADGKALSMLIVPQPLFESVSQDTQDILHGAFSQSLRSLNFERHTKFTKSSLDAVLDDLQNIRSNRECLIMTSKSVQCLVLKFIEQCAEHFTGADGSKEFPEELKAMRKILSLLSESGYPIIDEADSVLNVLHEVSFSCGSRLAPKTHELELMSEIYGIIYTDPTIKAVTRLESDPAAALLAPAAAPLLTEQLYYEKVQKPLAAAVIARLGSMQFSAAPLTDKMAAFIAKVTDKDHVIDHGHLMQYLCRDKEHIATAQKFFDALDPEIQDLLALAGEQLSHLLPYTLTRLCDEKYGIDEKSGGILAIPFSAANTPNKGSQFSNPHITMNYTFQTYMKKGVTAAMVQEQVALLQEKALREMAESGGKLMAKDTNAGKAFAKLKGDIDIPLFNHKSFQIDSVVRRINESAEAKREFVATIILPQMEHFETKVSCNAQNLVALFSKVMGFTGTLWNGLSMHHKVKPVAEAGTDAKTLSILWANSSDNAITIKEGSTALMLASLKAQGIAYDMISDAGGYFKEGSNSAIAHEMAASSGSGGKKAVAFYNADGEQALVDGAAELPLAQANKPAEERLTFLDQSHTTGADVSQKRDAISLVTIGRNMLLRDLLQSVWRLRGLDKSQRVRFLISDEVAGIIRQTLKLNERDPIQLDIILKFAIANQAAQQGRDNYKALKQQLANLSQQILFKVLLTQNLTPQAYLQAFRFLRTQWIKPASFSAKELYGTLATDVESAVALKQEKQESVDRIKEIFKKMPWLEQIGLTEKQCLDEVDIIANRIQDSLPQLLQIPSKETDNDQTVEVETETETETEAERETELEVQESTQGEQVKLVAVEAANMQEYNSFKEAVAALNDSSSSASETILTFHLDKCPVFALKSYLESDKDLSPYVSAFEGIYLSINALQWTSERVDFKLLGSSRMDFHHLLIQGSKVTVMSQNEAKYQRSSPDYYNLTLGYNDERKQRELPKDLLLKIVKIKFLNGEVQFNDEELKLLEIWFRSQGVAKMQKLYELILTGFPRKSARYQNSRLQQLFTKMR